MLMDQNVIQEPRLLLYVVGVLTRQSRQAGVMEEVEFTLESKVSIATLDSRVKPLE